MPRSRLKAPQRREQLIEVATKLFAEAGFDATPTAAIAKAAGVTEPILYRHFKSKADLFVAIVRDVSASAIESWQEAIATVADPAERVRKVARVMPEHVRRLSDEYHVLHGAVSTSRDPAVLAVLREHYATMETFFVGLIKEGQRAGSFRHDLDARAGAWQFIYAGIGYAMVHLNLTKASNAMTEAVIENLLRGLMK